jgi:3-hydroxyacyl-[acyl-carrier-protein] dehydratase
VRAPLATFEGSIRVGQEKAVTVEELTLAFEFSEVDTAEAEAASIDASGSAAAG